MATTENETRDKVLDDVLKAPGEGNGKESRTHWVETFWTAEMHFKQSVPRLDNAERRSEEED